jgi:hypothetical protein
MSGPIDDLLAMLEIDFEESIEKAHTGSLSEERIAFYNSLRTLVGRGHTLEEVRRDIRVNQATRLPKRIRISKPLKP